MKPEFLSEARELFSDTGIAVKTDGVTYLGGYIGSQQYRTDQLHSKLHQWQGHLAQCAKLAETQPRATYTTFVTAIQTKWLYLQRAMSSSPDDFEVLEGLVCEQLLTALTGHNPDTGSDLRQLYSLPARFGRLNIANLVSSARAEHDASRKITAPLVRLILGEEPAPPMTSLACSATHQ